MESKFVSNGIGKKTPNKSRPNHITFNGPSSPKIRHIEHVPRENGVSLNCNKNSVASRLNFEDRKNLPVYNARNRIIQEIIENDILILIGETGSGKTTQIPQYIHEERLERNKVIGVTQPRRVAATTISSRVSQEMNTQLGDLVGYSIRFEDVTSSQTKIKYLTDGMLLREAMLDENLMSYSYIILDEAHERTIHTDILFGIVKKAQKTRRERSIYPLKVIIMSATMDVDHFSSYFGDVPVLYLEGRQHSVNTFHAIQPQEDYMFSCLVTVFQIHQEAPPNHDILVFLTGQEEIETMVQNIRLIAKDLENVSPPLKVLPLYSTLPTNQQMDAFRATPVGMRKVIISTNIAETSVTVTGVKYVVDSGMVKARIHNPSSGLDILKVQRISQAQSWQRAGRAGRESDGFCYRIYTKSEFERMPKNAIPEIQRCNLSSVALQLSALGINMLHFDFMDKPPEELIVSSLEELKLLGAIDSTETTQLTKLGSLMARFPIDPRYSKILLSAKDFACVEEILSIIAILSGESILVNPVTKREEAKEAHKKFVSSAGDHITLLQIFRTFRKISQPKQWCRENYLNFRNLQYACNIRSQLSDICRKCDIPLVSCGQDFDKVRKCLITGLFMNVAELQTDKKYMMVATRQVVSVHPSSVLFGTLPHYVLFSEVIQTNKCYIRQLSVVDLDWFNEIMPEYFRRYRLSSTQER